MMIKNKKNYRTSDKGGRVRRRGEKNVRFREEGEDMRSLGVGFQPLTLLLAVSAVLENWPAAPALTPS